MFFRNPANLIKYSFCQKPENLNELNEFYDEVCEPLSKNEDKIEVDDDVFNTRE